ncbi:hypothetical protein BaRGS_00003317 [Batillaria attramentaria]|uniref:Uncharacterized protein n=1 Tax=Batillaria attramentaria TaxID=370345 RepID=A0ABD0M306_9CAEN
MSLATLYDVAPNHQPVTNKGASVRLIGSYNVTSGTVRNVLCRPKPSAGDQCTLSQEAVYASCNVAGDSVRHLR